MNSQKKKKKNISFHVDDIDNFMLRHSEWYYKTIGVLADVPDGKLVEVRNPQGVPNRIYLSGENGAELIPPFFVRNGLIREKGNDIFPHLSHKFLCRFTIRGGMSDVNPC